MLSLCDRPVFPYFDLLHAGKRTNPLPDRFYFGAAAGSETETNYHGKGELERFIEVDFVIADLSYNDIRRVSFALTNPSESNAPADAGATGDTTLVDMGLGRRFASAMSSGITEAYLRR